MTLPLMAADSLTVRADIAADGVSIELARVFNMNTVRAPTFVSRPRQLPAI
jgi:hypothetical protein